VKECPLKPVGHRIAVIPDTQPDTTASGLILPEDRDHVPVSGTVVALGPGGSQIRYRARQRAIRDCCEILESTMRTFGNLACLTLARDEMAGMLASTDPEREMHIGDRVAFAAEAGLTVTMDGQPYIVLCEDDVAVLAQELESVA
jgi:co-chaperonin GroES (HSP10)